MRVLRRYFLPGNMNILFEIAVNILNEDENKVYLQDQDGHQSEKACGPLLGGKVLMLTPVERYRVP